MIDLIAKEVN